MQQAMTMKDMGGLVGFPVRARRMTSRSVRPCRTPRRPCRSRSRRSSHAGARTARRRVCDRGNCLRHPRSTTASVDRLDSLRPSGSGGRDTRTRRRRRGRSLAPRPMWWDPCERIQPPGTSPARARSTERDSAVVASRSGRPARHRLAGRSMRQSVSPSRRRDSSPLPHGIRR